MAEIRAKLEGQLLTIQNQDVIASGDVNYDTCSFSFGEGWDGLAKTAAFYQDKKNAQYAVVGADGSCVIPSAAMAREGYMYVGVFGADGSRVVTSTVDRVYIRQGAISGDTLDADPGDDVFLAIVAQYQEIYGRMQEYDIKMDGFIKAMNAIGAYDVEAVLDRLSAAEGSIRDINASIQEAVWREFSDVSGGLKFGQDESGNWGYIPPDTTGVIPFGKGGAAQGGEIADADWVQVRSGTYGNFVKAICQDGCLVAITADGSVVHTTDGVTWKTHKLEYRDCRLADIEWDGARFIIAGSYMGERKTGLLLATEDFAEYRQIAMGKAEDSDESASTEYLDEGYDAVFFVNGKYIVVAECRQHSGSTSGYSSLTELLIYMGGLDNGEMSASEKGLYDINMGVAKNSSGMLLRVNHSKGGAKYDYVYKINNSGALTSVFMSRLGRNTPQIHVYTCKDTLYYNSASAEDEYELAKALESNEKVTIKTGQNFSFVGGAYFRGDEIFINSHSMLVVRKGESLADKTVDDLIEVAPECTITCVEKAFGGLYLFGNRGVILKAA